MAASHLRPFDWSWQAAPEPVCTPIGRFSLPPQFSSIYARSLNANFLIQPHMLETARQHVFTLEKESVPL